MTLVSLPLALVLLILFWLLSAKQVFDLTPERKVMVVKGRQMVAGLHGSERSFLFSQGLF